MTLNWSQVDVPTALTAIAQETDTYLGRYLQSLTGSPQQITDAMAYSLLGAGKRIRPGLAVLSSLAVGGTVEQGLVAGAAVEMIHCFSLIHDDLPAMDDDDLRRGRPTNHKVYGEAMAILAGDALNTLAFHLLATRVQPAALAGKLVTELAFATGPEGMIGGQVLDTCHPEEAKADTTAASLTKLQHIHRLKTGALINVACRMGAMAGGATETQLALIDRYGHAVGLAFQIVDDILDVTSTAEKMGKATGKDAGKGKLTYPSLLGLEASREHLAKQVAVTDAVTQELGTNARLLAELSRAMAQRTK